LVRFISRNVILSCMEIVKVGKKWQIVIPKKIREKLDIGIGERVIFKVERGEVSLQKLKIRKLKDILKAGKPLDVKSEEFQRKLREEWI